MSDSLLDESKPQRPSGPPKAKPRGRPFAPGNNANPQGRRVKSHRFTELYGRLCADMGGEGALNELQKTVLAQAVRVMMRAQRATKPEDVVRLSNCAARLMATVQSGRMNPRVPVPTPPAATFDAHMAQLKAAKAGTAAVADDGDGAA